MPDYIVTMSERWAAFVRRWLADDVQPVPPVVIELEQNREALRQAREELHRLKIGGR